MQVVPGSHNWDILCHVPADETKSFTSITAPLLPQHHPVSVPMQAGDCMFFHGALVHGSFPNVSANRFRRSLIGHYVEASTTELTQFDQPVLTFSNEERFLEASPGGMACGEWVDANTSNPHIVTRKNSQQEAVAHG
jgi:phytanoyl-CoA hydroxylase